MAVNLSFGNTYGSHDGTSLVERFLDNASEIGRLTIDLGIDERYKSVIQNYIKFFGEKKRTQAFYDLEIERFNRNTITIHEIVDKCNNITGLKTDK